MTCLTPNFGVCVWGKTNCLFKATVTLGFYCFQMKTIKTYTEMILQQEHTALATRRGHMAPSWGLGAAVHGCNLRGVLTGGGRLAGLGGTFQEEGSPEGA